MMRTSVQIANGVYVFVVFCSFLCRTDARPNSLQCIVPRVNSHRPLLTQQSCLEGVLPCAACRVHAKRTPLHYFCVATSHVDRSRSVSVYASSAWPFPRPFQSIGAPWTASPGRCPQSGTKCKPVACRTTTRPHIQPPV